VKSIEELLESKGIIPERPPSIDAKGHRVDIFTAKVAGVFRTRRDLVYTFLLFLFLVVPWTTFEEKPTIQLDLWNKEFTFFGTTFLAHEGPLVFFIFGIVVFALLMATALYGRIWCGWACPQTVFIDGVFRRIEEWVEGNHIKRKKLASQPYNKEKILKKVFKWTIFLVVSSHIAHSIIAYFIGAKSLFWITIGGPEGYTTLFVFTQIFTILIAVNFGWFKEQFCLVACPYGRLQSAIMDQHSKTVIYDYKRGEPRRENKKNAYADCVNCFKCVAVCPTGIDIRDGQQLECIGCTACIDACDTVMEKLNKPKGLVRYASEYEIESGEPSKKMFSLRSLLYSTGLTFMVLCLSYFVYFRADVSVKLIRATDAPFQVSVSENGKVLINHFKLHIHNQGREEVSGFVFVTDRPNVRVVTPPIFKTVSSGGQRWIHIFLKMPLENFDAKDNKIQWMVKYHNKFPGVKSGSLKFLGPG